MKYIKLISVLLITSTLTFCSNDDNDSVRNSSSSIPEGEIVAVEKRDEALTGFSSSSNSKNLSSQKWWIVKKSFIGSSGSSCPNEEINEAKELLNESTGNHTAFTADGDIFVKLKGEEPSIRTGSWSWTDDTKSSISIGSNDVSGILKVTYLNDNNVVYGNTQTGEGCTVTQYVQFHEPYK